MSRLVEKRSATRSGERCCRSRSCAMRSPLRARRTSSSVGGSGPASLRSCSRIARTTSAAFSRAHSDHSSAVLRLGSPASEPTEPLT